MSAMKEVSSDVIEVVDSAVKIGLGALISGVFLSRAASAAFERDARTEYARRRRDMLEKVVDMLIAFDKVYRHQKALYDTFCLTTSPAERARIKQEFDALDEQLRVAFERFADASGILLMLGEADAEAALDAYYDAANKWYETPLPEAPEADLSALEPLKGQVLVTRCGLMKKLSSAYRRL